MVGESVPTRVAGSVDATVDGQRILLSPRDFSYFAIEGSGAHVWDLIDGSRSVNEIVAMLAERFATPDDTLALDAAEFLSTLIDAGLIEFHAANVKGI